MKGRKPKYSQEEMLDICQRYARGESATDLSKATGKPRTSILRIVESARVPAELRDQLAIQLQVKQADKLHKLNREDIEKALRRIGKLAPKANENGMAKLVAALVAIQPALPRLGGAVKSRIGPVADETALIFERFTGSRIVGVVPAAVASIAASQVDLGGPKGDVLDVPSSGDGAGRPGKAGEENSAT